MTILNPAPVGATPIEPDLVQGDPTAPEAFHELKTGTAELTPESLQDILKTTPAGGIQVIQA